jgi:FKBP-type peptidyl-prolyl cis-trans isomerase
MGQVIKGWDEALTTLNVGTKAIIVIPSNLAYGAEGAGNGAIPPNSDLLFYIDIVK